MDLRANDQIIKYSTYTNFFEERNLIQDASARKKCHKDFINHYVKLIQSAKKY